jgi:hypothetical protein
MNPFMFSTSLNMGICILRQKSMDFLTSVRPRERYAATVLLPTPPLAAHHQQFMADTSELLAKLPVFLRLRSITALNTSTRTHVMTPLFVDLTITFTPRCAPHHQEQASLWPVPRQAPNPAGSTSTRRALRPQTSTRTPLAVLAAPPTTR